MKIVCLCENTPFNNRFYYEHGLSLYIEANGLKILFDTGQSDVFYKNALLCGIDLSLVDIAVISHGHYDHGGGIKKFLELNSKANIYISKFAFDEHYNGKDKYIGLDCSLKENKRLVLCGDYLKISPESEIFSENKSNLLFPADSAGLNIKKDNVFTPDNFIHEQYLKINENGKTYLSADALTKVF